MPQTFVVSDHHLGHQNACMFTRPNGAKMRPFNTAAEADEVMIANWNKVVGHDDIVWHLGDVALRKDFIRLIARCNGQKKLVLGNHDKFEMAAYLPFFNNIYGVKVVDNVLLSHIPVHPFSLQHRWLGNIHGHCHNSVPAGHYGPRYLNVSVEVLDYTPITLEEAKDRLRKQIAAAGQTRTKT